MDQQICSICRSSLNHIGGAKAVDYVSSDEFSVITCISCGTAFTIPVPTNLDHYYPQKYREYGPLVFWGLRLLFQSMARDWTDRYKNNKSRRLLEIGCGPGALLSCFAQKGWKVLGLERNGEMALKAMQQHNVKVLDCDVSGLPDTEYFDLILLFNVLEHVENPANLLKECKSRLTDQGKIVVTVPDYTSWQSTVSGSTWLHLDVPRHLNHFSRRSIETLAFESGLSVGKIRGASIAHDLFGWVDSLISIILGSHNVLTSWLMGLQGFKKKTLIGLLLLPWLTLVFFPVTILSFIMKRSALFEAQFSKM